MEQVITEDKGKVEKEEKISVSKKFLKELQSEIESLKEKQSILEEAADKGAMALAYQRRSQDDVPKEVRVRVLDNQIVVGWRTTQDEVYQDPATRRWIEIQKVEVLLENGESREMFLMDFNRKFTHLVCKRIGITTDESTGSIAYTLKKPDGVTIAIGATFVN